MYMQLIKSDFLLYRDKSYVLLRISIKVIIFVVFNAFLFSFKPVRHKVQSIDECKRQTDFIN